MSDSIKKSLICHFLPTGEIIYTNKVFSEILTKKSSMLLSDNSIFDFFNNNHISLKEKLKNLNELNPFIKFKHSVTIGELLENYETSIICNFNIENNLEKYYLVCSKIENSAEKRIEIASEDIESQNMFDNLPFLIFKLDSELKCIYVNDLWIVFTGKSKDELLGIGWQNYLKDEEFKHFEYIYNESLKSCKGFNSELHLRNLKGEFKCFLTIGLPHFNKFANALEYWSFCIDVSDQKKLNEELNTALFKYKVLFESFPVGITISDHEGNIVEANQESERLLGLQKQDQKKRKIDGNEWRLLRSDGSDMPPEEFASTRALKEKQRIDNVEMGIVKNSDEITWINVSAAPLSLTDYGLVISYFDITPRKMLEKSLLDSSALMENIFSGINESIIILKHIDRYVIACNTYVEKMFGYKVDEIVGKQIDIIALNDDLNKNTVLEIEDSIEKKGVFQGEIVLKNKDGAIIIAEAFIRPVYETEQKIEYTISFLRDITEKKHYEKQLQANEERLRLIFNTTSSGMLILNYDGTISDINLSACSMLGLDYEDINKQNSINVLWNTFQEDGTPFVQENHPVIQSIKTGKPVKNVIMTIENKIDKISKWVLVDSEPLLDKNFGIIQSAIVSFTDITEARNAQNELLNYKKHLEELVEERTARNLQILKDLEEEIAEHRKSQISLQKSWLILHSITDGVITLNEDFKITSINRAAKSIIDISENEAIGKLFSEVFRIENSNLPLWELFKYGSNISIKLTHLKNTKGNLIPVSLNATLLENWEESKKEAVISFRDNTQVEILQREINKQFYFYNMISKNTIMQNIFNQLPDIAKSNSTVLIQGSTGTGKELIAKAIYELSDKNKNHFLVINCAALPASIIESELFGFKKGSFTHASEDRMGKIVSADGGTIFFDEIAELSLETQAKLLRLIENLEVDRIGYTKPIKVNIRILSATNRDLKELVEQKLFREDLYFRLNTVKISLPPLNERKEDIPYLIQHFIKIQNARLNKEVNDISTDCMRILLNYEYPGNIRELEKIIEFAMIMNHGDIIELQHLPIDLLNNQYNEYNIQQSINNNTNDSMVDLLKEIRELVKNKRSDKIAGYNSINELNEEYTISKIKQESKKAGILFRNMQPEKEKAIILEALENCAGNKTKAANMLNIHYTTLLYKLKKYNIQ